MKTQWCLCIEMMLLCLKEGSVPADVGSLLIKQWGISLKILALREGGHSSITKNT